LFEETERIGPNAMRPGCDLCHEKPAYIGNGHRLEKYSIIIQKISTDLQRADILTKGIQISVGSKIALRLVKSAEGSTPEA
jgi:hypothetical protein